MEPCQQVIQQYPSLEGLWASLFIFGFLFGSSLMLKAINRKESGE